MFTVNIVQNPEIVALLNELGIDLPVIGNAVSNSRQALFDRDHSLMTGMAWLDDHRLLFFIGRITKKHLRGDEYRVTKIDVSLALRLFDELPAGRLTRTMDMETALAIIAESFGEPLSCHPDEPYSTLYSGPSVLDPGKKGMPLVRFRRPLDEYYLCGGNRPMEGYAEHCWAFVLDRYLTWCRAVG